MLSSSSSNLLFYAHSTSMVISGRNLLRKYRSVSNLSVQPDLGQHFYMIVFDVIVVSCVLTHMANILCDEG